MILMQTINYMSMVFRGAVEDYEKTGVHPSVFLDSNGELQIYLCDPVAAEEEFETTYGMGNYEANGAQFVSDISENENIHEVNYAKLVTPFSMDD
jgi:hypothetical protein